MDEGPDKVGRALARLYLILCVIVLAATVIHLVPEHRRRMARLRLLRLSALVTSRLARRTGAASMRRELETGDQLYGVPYRLSLWRAGLERAYDRARDASL